MKSSIDGLTVMKLIVDIRQRVHEHSERIDNPSVVAFVSGDEPSISISDIIMPILRNFQIDKDFLIETIWLALVVSGGTKWISRTELNLLVSVLYRKCELESQADKENL